MVGAVVVLAIVGGALAWLGSGSGGDQASAGDSPAPVTSPSAAGPADGAGADPGGSSSGDTGPAPASSRPVVPHVKLSAGDCFDSPGLDSKVTVITRRSCDTPHYAEVVSEEKLTGVVASETDLRDKAFAVCKSDIGRRMESIPEDGDDYYTYVLFPDLATYQMGDQDMVSCSLTKSHGRDGKQLTAPLP
ncbi:hypothetical protein CK485_15065 [Streptomyces sp. ICBB 8177]|nr:hypothetical protein CK485_15065 [Streptomyces sp. ICBB 8177]